MPWNEINWTSFCVWFFLYMYCANVTPGYRGTPWHTCIPKYLGLFILLIIITPIKLVFTCNLSSSPQSIFHFFPFKHWLCCPYIFYFKYVLFFQIRSLSSSGLQFNEKACMEVEAKVQLHPRSRDPRIHWTGRKEVSSAFWLEPREESPLFGRPVHNPFIKITDKSHVQKKS